MSDNIKLIIEIPKEVYEQIVEAGDLDYLEVITAIENGIPLDDVKKEIAEAYANTRGMFPNYASGLSHAYRIIDKCVGKAESEE